MRNRLIFLLVLMLHFAFPNSLVAQQNQNLRFERFTLRNGLASDWVQRITQDRLGYIWVATATGLSRFDGYEFVNFRNIPGDPKSLSNNRLNTVFIDSKGNLWVGSQNGLSLFDPINENFENFYHDPENPNSLPGKIVSDIFESSTGQLWVGTINGLAAFDYTTKSFTSQWISNGQTISLNGVTIKSISEDSHNTLWIGSSNKGLITFNTSTNAIQFLNEKNDLGLEIPSINVSKVKVVSTGDIWIGFTSGIGLLRYNPTKKTTVLYAYNELTQPTFSNNISDIIETADHSIWITTFNDNDRSGLHKFDEQTGLFSRNSYQPYNLNSLAWAYTETVFEDKDNNLWVGTSRGLNKADLTRWQMGFMSLDPQNPFSFLNNFYAIGEIEKDVFWFGLDGDGFVEWNRKTNEKKHFNNTDPRAKEGIQVIKKDQDGIFWLGHKQNGLSRYNSKTGKLDNYQNNANDPSSLVSNFVTDIIIDRNNDIWISTSQGLSKFNRKEKNFSNWQKEVNAPEMSGNALFSLFQDSKGFIWIGTKDQPVDPNSKFPTGLMKFDPETNHFTTYRSNPNDASSLSSDAIYVVNEDLNGNIWVGTNNGLNKLDINGEKFEVYHTADGLADPNIIGILIDDDGNIWLSTLKGISRFNPKTKKFRNYDFEDGIQGYRYNDNSRLKTSTGELFFGGVAGANFFNPAEVSSEKVVPNILITKFLIQNMPFHFQVSIDKTEKVELAWDENSIGFEFVAINFRSSQQTQYEYKLEGLEKEWVQAGTRRFVNYTHLPIGNYTFRVRALNAEGIYSGKDAILKVVIIPPFWRTWLAYIIYAFIFVGIIFVIDRFQRIRLLRKEKEKARDRELVQAKEIEKSYTELKAMQAQLIQSEKMASLGELTAGIAHEIQNPLNFVNNFSDVNTELIREMKEELKKANIIEAQFIADDIEANEQKINHHGKRADAIVKGMLQHSRSSSGVKEPTDINDLADEYLRLAYHGLRAKDKSFNAILNTDFDDTIGKINIVPQDIGRVILNLITNAFYVVDEKKKLMGEDFAPSVSVSTKKEGDKVFISVRDNGNGIPQHVLDKIFQPFFTTKPTGQGTGLGLSLSYDSVKAHGGTLKVQTKEGEGSEFIIQLPI